MNDFLLDEFLRTLRDRISPLTAIAAIVAAGGMTIMLIGFVSVQRVNLDGEAERISGVTRPSRLDQLQMRLIQSGLRIKLGEFLLIGLLIGILLGAVLMLSGFVVIGLVAIPSGPVLYYRFLMDRRNLRLKAFRDQLPDAILDFIQYLAVKKDLVETIKEMMAKGPEALRPEFGLVNSLVQRKVSVDAALEAVGQARPEAFFRQFMDALAQHHLNGGNLKVVLERIARGQRAQQRLQDRIVSQQAGARFVGVIYAVAPVAFMLFVRATGGESYTAFYSTPLGRVAQVFILASGVVSWWLTNKIAHRGIYLDDNASAPTLKGEVRQRGQVKEVVHL